VTKAFGCLHVRGVCTARIYTGYSKKCGDSGILAANGGQWRPLTVNGSQKSLTFYLTLPEAVT
jgi:hypothetical protein